MSEGLIGDFIDMLGQPLCIWTKRDGDELVSGRNVPRWGESLEIGCIFKPERRIENAASGAVIVKPATFRVEAEHAVSIGDKIEFRGHDYIVEAVKDIDWFGGVHDGYKCECRQEGGVPVP